jgi:hypothetical protein
MDPIENNDTQRRDAPLQKMNSLNAQTKMAVAVGLIVFLALVAFGAFASNSLPGTALYGFKTEFLEGLNESIQFKASDKAAYQASKMEARIKEIKQFSENGGFSAEALDDLKRVITDHFATLEQIVASDAGEKPDVQMLGAINDFASAAFAAELISERDQSLQELGEFIEDVRRDSVNLYKDEVDRYVERETPEKLNEFIMAQLKEVSDAIGTDSIRPQTIDDAQVYINRVGPAVAEADYPKAIAAIAEAMRFIHIDMYGAIEEQKEATSTPNTGTSTASSSTSTTELPSEQEPGFTFPQ